MVMHSYSSPLALGHKFLEGFWEGVVVVEEKVDGSQLSLRVDPTTNVVEARSRRMALDMVNPEKLFAPAIETFLNAHLIPGETYRGESMSRPKANTIAYARAPKGGFALFDVDYGDQDYADPSVLARVAEAMGVEAVPVLGVYESQPPLEELQALLERESFLGGSKIEGIVLKNYGVLGPDHKVMMAKLVSADFQETHKHDWRERNPTKGDIIEKLIAKYKTEARWRKAVAHLREEGLIRGVPQDIPLVLREAKADILADSREDIATELVEWYWKKEIAKGVTAGLPEYYLAMLAAGDVV